MHIPGQILPAARTIASASAREILAFVVRSNIEALHRLARQRSRARRTALGRPR